MWDSLVEWTSYEVAPAIQVAFELTLHALDSLPLPILIVIFLALLASLRSPAPHPTPLLPSYSPSFSEKSRLSPLPNSPPSLPLPSGTTTRFPPNSPVFYPTVDTSGKPTYTAVIENSGTSSSGTASPPRLGNYGRQRGSKRFGGAHGHWRSNSLGIVPELREDKAEV